VLKTRATELFTHCAENARNNIFVLPTQQFLQALLMHTAA
jgi:hypothetical protein